MLPGKERTEDLFALEVDSDAIVSDGDPPGRQRCDVTEKVSCKTKGETSGNDLPGFAIFSG